MTTSSTEPSLDQPLPIERVVVGVDGSVGSLNALRWALREARAHEAALHVVFAWLYHPMVSNPGLGSMFPVSYGVSGRPPGAGPGEPVTAGVLEAEAAARNFLEAAIDKAIADGGDDPSRRSVQITQDVIEGHAARVLLDVATESDLLVVGSRGHGEFVGALLGSISQHVIAHARCPVVVVPCRHHD